MELSGLLGAFSQSRRVEVHFINTAGGSGAPNMRLEDSRDFGGCKKREPCLAIGVPIGHRMGPRVVSEASDNPSQMTSPARRRSPRAASQPSQRVKMMEGDQVSSAHRALPVLPRTCRASNTPPLTGATPLRLCPSLHTHEALAPRSAYSPVLRLQQTRHYKLSAFLPAPLTL